ncbi:NUDIX hydrolase [Yoonia vestfoldensis]|jgi:8-oxo-dGTP pyrophosphatase MutT (NUDIX family)|uniref:NUDIX domain protein n=1 Tax=Yoonia vestfoldensis TaxID=245188 RepID=A0A1Y0E971_9RHOB|nr:NUDIX hydrolase [Yoonia vestfoldensis]ARU00048.1 NUDIX domain protein [Yoonia vestfoldensis]
MTNLPAQQIPLKFATGRKTDIRAQFAALCWRIVDDKVEICLVTSRTRGRWILPKGWPMHKQTPAAAAAMEAYEEAGLRGEVLDVCLGIYSYIKPLGNVNAPIVAMVYPVHVTDVLSDWPEKRQRKRKWFSPKKAAKKLEEPALKRIVATFDPALLR